MRKVGSREFKNRMGQYLSEVRRGLSVVITDRGKPIAKLVPPDNAELDQDPILQKLEDLERQGLLRLGRGTLKPFRPIKTRGKPASQMIIEDRR